LPVAQIAGNLDLAGATLKSFDFRDAFVAGEMRLVDEKSSVHWFPPVSKAAQFDLRGARVGSLLDKDQSWPERGYSRLDGFTFDRLGGFEDDSRAEMLKRAAVGGTAMLRWTKASTRCLTSS
jgi:hypothetical protein